MWSAKRDTPGSRRLTRFRTLKACEEFPAALQAAQRGKIEPGVALVSLAYPWLLSLHASGVRDRSFEHCARFTRLPLLSFHPFEVRMRRECVVAGSSWY